MNIDFEPFKPINTSLYLCDNKFHTEALAELLESDDKFGFIVMDGNGSLYGTVAGSHREIVHKFSVDLPKKHGRGGQSALRFARLRLEKRHNYVRKVAETATQMFITNDKVNVAGIVLAGSADFKNDLAQSDIFDQRLVAKVLTLPLTLTLTLALALTLTLTLTLSLTLNLTRTLARNLTLTRC